MQTNLPIAKKGSAIAGALIILRKEAFNTWDC